MSNPVENNQDSISNTDLWHGEAAFEAFVKKHYRHLCFCCHVKFGLDMQLAEDVVNSSFIKLWEVRQTLHADVSPKSYLYKIIHNTSLNILKHKKVKQQHAEEVLKTTPEHI